MTTFDNVLERHVRVPDFLIKLCDRIASLTFLEAFGLSHPRAWQLDIVRHLLLSNQTKLSGVRPAPVLLCQPTGGGKSIAWDAYSAASGGVSIITSPLLALGTDQVKNIKRHASRGDGVVGAIHLDDCTSNAKLLRPLCDKLRRITVRSASTVMLVCSPQSMCHHKAVRKLLLDLLSAGSLRLVTVDEMHLFVQFGLRFRSEFGQLRKHLFDHLVVGKDKAHTKIPVLFMTAACNDMMLKQAESLSSLSFEDHNIFWLPPDQLLQRKCNMHFLCSPRPFIPLRALLQEMLGRTKEDGVMRKLVVFANSRLAVENMADKTRKHLDKENLPGDCVVIVGTQFKEQKLHNTSVFLADRGSTVDEPVAFDPRIAFVTRSLGSAGWDSGEICRVFSPDLPTSVASFVQEIGRAGRRDGADTSTDSMTVCACLESCLSVIKRNHMPSDDDKSTSDKHMKLKPFRQLCDFEQKEFLKCLLLSKGCLHVALRRRLLNPRDDAILQDSRCPAGKPQCDGCSGKIAKMLPKLRKDNVIRAMHRIFVGPNVLHRPQFETNMVQTLRTPSNSELLFGSKSAKAPEPLKTKQMLLMLIAADMLGHKVIFENSDKKKKSPIVVAVMNLDHRGKPAIESSDLWKMLPQKQ